MAANALPAIPLALSNKPDTPLVNPFVRPDNDPAIALKPPVTVLAKLPANAPADNNVDAVPNTLDTPGTCVNAPVIV